MKCKQSHFRAFIIVLLFLYQALFPFSTMAQTKVSTVKGIVHDEKNQPLAGTSVLIRNSKTNFVSGTKTDTAGVFIANVPAGGPYSFSFSNVSYESQTLSGYNIKEGITFTVDVQMKSAIASLDQVVVVGYGTQRKANITGAVSTIKMDDALGDRPLSTTADLLQGAIPGLQVTINTGQPGASSPALNVRGGTSFSANSISSGGPFVVVDNVPFVGSLDLLDPNDIESVSLLKDAGAAAIYGSRSAFGVLLITTKRGAKNQPARFNYSNNFVNSTVAPLPPKATPLQFIQSYIDGGNTTYQGQPLTSWVSLLNDYNKNPQNYPGGYTMINGTYLQLAPTDAIGDFLGSSARQQMHNLSVTGGNDKTTYRVSFGTTNENGIIVPEAHQDYFKRYNLKSVVTTDVNKWMNVQLDVGINSSSSAQPYYQVVTASDAFQQISNTTPLVPIDTVPGIGKIASPKYWLMNTAPIMAKNNEARVSGRVILKPINGLTVTGEYTLDRFNSNTATYDKYATGLNAAGGAVTTGTPGGVYTKVNGLTNYNAFNVFGSYTTSVNRVHTITVMGGINNEDSHAESVSASKGNLIDPNNPALATATSATPTVGDSYTEYANTGVFGRVSYDYKNKYLVQVNGRYDGSSKFPEGHRWGFFPSFSAGWRLMEEDFMKGLKPVINEFKLRGSFGAVGNQNIAAYAYNGVMPSSTPAWLNSGAQVITVSQPSQLVSSNFTWETVESLDFGADIGILKNKLSIAFDWYKRETKGILTNGATQLPAILGIGAPLVNAGTLQTKGFEVGLEWKDRIGKVGYNVGINLSNYETIVTQVSNPTNVLSSLFVGQKMGDIWGFVTDRLYTADDFVEGTLDINLKNGVLKPGIPKTFNSSNGSQQAPNPGDILYKDLDGNDTINVGKSTLDNHGDRQVIGNSIPKFRFGINGGVSYKNFDLSFVLLGVLNQQQWVANNLTFPNYWAGQSALYSHELNYWTPNSPDAYYGRIYTTTGVPAGTGIPAANQNVQTRFLQNDAYLRVKNITIRYSLQSKLLKKVHINKLQFFYSAEDPFILDHLPEGVYPDIVRSGSGSGGGIGYPFMKKSSLGLNLSF